MNIFSILGHNILESPEANDDLNKAFVYIASIDNYNHCISFFWECLSIREQKRAASYSRKSLADQYIISHGLLRYILSYYAEQPARNLKFTINKYGKPSLNNSRVKFNMSHSHNIVTYIIAYDHEVGIDVEHKDTSLNITELFNEVLDPKELILFESVEPKAWHAIFFNLWTKKEALIKAIGNGLSYPVNTINTLSISVNNKISLSNEYGFNKQALYVYTLELLNDYSISIASDNQISRIICVKIYGSFPISV